MLVASLLALAVSTVALALLGIVDPKRRRIGRDRVLAAAASRRPLVLLALIPGAVLAATSQWAALLIWIGGCTVIGWAVAVVLAPGRGRARFSG